MNNGDVWDLNIPLEFQHRVKIQLYDLDNPGFPLYDDHDHLGTVIIRPDQPEGSGTFHQDGADYDLDWIAAPGGGRPATDQRFTVAKDGQATFSPAALDAMTELPANAEDAVSAEAASPQGLFGSKHTYCCSMGNNGRVSERQQFRSYSWQAPLFCMRMARGKGYNSGSVSRGECPSPGDDG